ncbi:hypothetical protein GDO78_015214 [Eleutherodactylus coqui]|uniref:Uncharacterized protein n=1 Tax=Eleutherodactylus coqui TaxID=57060 RepID=A0A8J6BEA0_ELECQ|nr:hypothetical protein GDO78_015214 [Eleutherodactylus coqui]
MDESDMGTRTRRRRPPPRNVKTRPRPERATESVSGRAATSTQTGEEQFTQNTSGRRRGLLVALRHLTEQKTKKAANIQRCVNAVSSCDKYQRMVRLLKLWDTAPSA